MNPLLNLIPNEGGEKIREILSENREETKQEKDESEVIIQLPNISILSNSVPMNEEEKIEEGKIELYQPHRATTEIPKRIIDRSTFREISLRSLARLQTAKDIVTSQFFLGNVMSLRNKSAQMEQAEKTAVSITPNVHLVPKCYTRFREWAKENSLFVKRNIAEPEERKYWKVKKVARIPTYFIFVAKSRKIRKEAVKEHRIKNGTYERYKEQRMARRLQRQRERKGNLIINQPAVYSQEQLERQVILPPQLNFYGQHIEPVGQQPIVEEPIVQNEVTNIPPPSLTPLDVPSFAFRENSVAFQHSPISSEVGIEKSQLVNKLNELTAEIVY